VGKVSPEKDSTHTTNQLGTLQQFPEIVRVNRVDEIIFSAGDLTSQEIIKSMLSLVSLGVDFKIAPPDSMSVIGSNSIDTSGDLYTVELSAITQPHNKRTKRILDITVAFLTILFAPLTLAMNRTTRKMLSYSPKVLLGSYTWVSFAKNKNNLGLPKIKSGIFTPAEFNYLHSINCEQAEKTNILYAKNYSFSKDIKIIWKNIINKNIQRNEKD
jgi:hypothetical protein